MAKLEQVISGDFYEVLGKIGEPECNSFSEWKRTDSTFCDCCRRQSGNAFQDQYLG